jgi:uncharacterized membrane protein
MRSVIFALQHKPYRRLRQPQSSQTRIRTLLSDSIDLWCSFHGLNWEWSAGSPAPLPSSSLSFRSRILLLGNFFIQVIMFDFLHYYMQTLDPQGFGSKTGVTIFNMDHTPLRRYTDPITLWRSILAGFSIYLLVEIPCSLPRVLAISIFNCPVEEWPPISNEPWKATSLIEFWGKRWQQLLRFCFTELGYKPFAWISGGNRSVGLLGAFFVSGVCHYLVMWAQYPDASFVHMVGFFVMMGVGVVLEYAWRKLTGKKVEGHIGRLWLLVWVIGWGQFAVDVCSQTGMLSSEIFGKNVRPSYKVFGQPPL